MLFTFAYKVMASPPQSLSAPAYILSFCVPTLLLLIAIILIAVQARHWLRTDKPVPTRQPSAFRRRFYPLLWLTLALFLISPSVAILVFLASRNSDRLALQHVKSSHTLELELDVPHYGDKSAAAALSDTQLHALVDRLDPYVIGLKLPAPPTQRNTLLNYMRESQGKRTTTGDFLCEFTTLFLAPRAHYGRFVRPRYLSTANLRLPLLPEDLATLTRIHQCEYLYLNIPDQPPEQTDAQITAILQWTQNLDFRPVTYIICKVQPSTSTLDLLTRFEHVNSLTIHNINDIRPLTDLSRFPRLQVLSLSFAFPTDGSAASLPNFTTCPNLTSLTLNNLGPITDDQLPDFSRLRSLTITNAPNLTGKFLGAFPPAPAQAPFLSFAHVPLHAATPQIWESLPITQLDLTSPASEELVFAISHSKRLSTLFLVKTPLTRAMAKALARSPTLQYLDIDQPAPDALSELLASPSIANITVWTHHCESFEPEIQKLKTAPRPIHVTCRQPFFETN